MRIHSSTDPSRLRSKAQFFQRLACLSRTVQQREELEELSVASMEEAAELEKIVSGHAYEIKPKSRREDDEY